MNRTRAKSLIDAYVAEAPAILSAYFTASCCLNGTRVLVDSMKSFGLSVAPVVVEMMAYNKIWGEELEKNQGFPQNETEKKHFIAAGGYALACGGEHDSGGWPHHLVGFCSATGHIVDSSAGQIARPKWDIDVPQVMTLKVPGSFVTKPEFHSWTGPKGQVLAYRSSPGIPFRHLPGFQDSPWNRKATAEVVRAIRKRAP